MAGTTDVEPAAEETRVATLPPVRLPHTYQGEDDPGSLYMTTSAFDQLQRVAKLMASSSLVPEHLRDKLSDCFLVAACAVRWKMDPFAVAQHTFVTKGKLGYEGKLIAAIINTHRRVAASLKYRYTGEPGTPKRGVIVSGVLKGDPTVLEVDGTVERWATTAKEERGGGLSDQWRRDPDQLLAYRGARQWARRYLPEAVLGVYSDDEVEQEADVTLERQPDGSYGAPPTPAARLDDLAGKLKGRRHIDQPEAPKEPTSILEGQLRKSLDMLGEQQRAQTEAKAQREREAARTKMDTKGQLCLHSETQQLAGGQVVCRKCGVVLFEAETREPGQDG